MDNILNTLRNTDIPIIIYGAGIVGQVLFDYCQSNGIEVTAFCDDSKKVCATSNEFQGRKLIPTSGVSSVFKDVIFLISVASIGDAVNSVYRNGFDKWYAGGELLQSYNVNFKTGEGKIDYTKFAIENCVMCHMGYLNENNLFIRSIDLIITERCSLKCSQCSNLMQYYQSPQNCNIDTLFKEIDKLCEVATQIMDFRLIGGDVFMNKDWHLIVDKLDTKANVERIVLYTNGTIIPNQKYVDSLKNDKVLVIATNYGEHLSKKIGDLENLFKSEGIAYNILEVTEWLKCSDITQHNRSNGEANKIFQECCAKNMMTTTDGKLFRCPYSANAWRLKAVPDFKDDYVDVFDESKTVNELKSDIKSFLQRTTALGTCDFCNGRPLSGDECPPAEQIREPLPYKAYSHES